jgi:hypothetical protein
MKRALAALLAGLALAIPQARAELRGKVHMLVNPDAPRTEWRRVPLPGAYIAVFWSVTVPAPAHAVTTCRYSEFARSDEKGEYVMEGPNFVTAAVAHTWFLVYSPGAEQVNFPYGGTPQTAVDITMTKSTLAPPERLSRIWGYTDPHCPDTKLNDPHNLLDAYHRILLEEARSLQVETPMGQRELRGIEAAARRASGADKRGPVRVIVAPSSGSMQRASPPPDERRQAAPLNSP